MVRSGRAARVSLFSHQSAFEGRSGASDWPALPRQSKTRCRVHAPLPASAGRFTFTVALKNFKSLTRGRWRVEIVPLGWKRYQEVQAVRIAHLGTLPVVTISL